MTSSSVSSATSAMPREFAEPFGARESEADSSLFAFDVLQTQRLSAGRRWFATTLPAVLACAAAAYFCAAYVPAMATYFRVNHEARALVLSAPANPQAAVRTFLARVQKRSGVAVDPRSVKVRAKGGKLSHLRFSLRVPIRFPGLRAGRALTFGINLVADPKQE